MSYRFGMGFIEIDKDKYFDHVLSFIEKCTENAEEFLEKEKYYIPSSDISSEKCPKYLLSKLDNMWLYNVFNISFVYWEDKKLLSVVGYSFPKKAEEMFPTWMSFQNSTDQNYDYEWWDGISYFEKFVEEAKKLTASDILKTKNPIYTLEDIESNLEYYQQTYVYDQIYENLQLSNWLYDHEGNFKRFSVNCIDSTEKFYEISNILKKIKKELY